MTSQPLADFMSSGEFGTHIRRARRLYRERHRLLRTELASQLPEGLRLLDSNAGLHLAVVDESGCLTADFPRRTALSRIAVSSLALTYQHGPPVNGLIVGFGALRAHLIPAAVKALSLCLVGDG